MRYNTNKTPEEELRAEVVRAAIAYVDYERVHIARGTFTATMDREQERLHKSVDALRLLRKQKSRTGRRGSARR